MKKPFVSPQCTAVRLAAEDIIVTSALTENELLDLDSGNPDSITFGDIFGKN